MTDRYVIYFFRCAQSKPAFHLMLCLHFWTSQSSCVYFCSISVSNSQKNQKALLILCETVTTHFIYHTFTSTHPYIYFCINIALPVIVIQWDNAGYNRPWPYASVLLDISSAGWDSKGFLTPVRPLLQNDNKSDPDRHQCDLMTYICTCK